MSDDDIETDNADAGDGVLRKKDLFDYVTENTSLNRKTARHAVEATLECLRQALANEKDAILPPLGKIECKRQKIGTVDEKVVYKLKLRTAGQGNKIPSKDALAEVID